MQQMLSDLAEGTPSPDDRERRTLISWLFIQHALPDEQLIAEATELLDLRGLRKQADQFASDIVASLHSKERTVRICFEHLHLPVEAARLKYIEFLHTAAREIPLSEIKV